MKRKIILSPLIIVLLIVLFGAGIAGAAIYFGTTSGGEANTTGVNLQKGLVGWWDFNGNAKDITPNSNHGVVTGATLTSDRKGQVDRAYSFTGSTDKINMGSSTDFESADGTWELWFNASEGNFDNYYLMTKNQAGYGDDGNLFFAGNTDRRIRWGIEKASDSSAHWIYSDSAINVGIWYHVAVVWGSGGLKMYVDGVQQINTDSFSGGIVSSGNPLYVGYALQPNKSFNGKIDDVRIYNRALSAAEITALYHSYDSGVVISDLQKGLVGSWDFNGNAKDITPNSNHGTVTGATLTSDRKGQVDKAYSFDGSSHVDLGNPASLQIANTVSIAAWVYLKSELGTIQAWFANGYTHVNSIYIGTHTGYPSAWWAMLGGTTEFGFGNKVFNQWTHLVITLDLNLGSNQLKAYQNGTLVAQANRTSDIMTRSSTRYLSGDLVAGSGWNGYLDDVRIYNRALSSAEITALYQSYDPSVQISDLQKGLVGSWDFNGNAKDITPNSNHGAITGATLTSDRKGELNKSYNFNGASYINVGSGASLDFTSAMTVATWVKFTGLDYTGGTGTLNFIAAKGYPDSPSPNAGWWFSYDNRSNGNNFAYTCFGNSAGGYAGGGNNFGSGSYSYTFTNGVWYHLAFTISGSTAKLYINGTQKGSDLALSNLVLSSPAAPLYIGTTASYYLRGALDDVRVWNRALPPAEIAALYQSYE